MSLPPFWKVKREVRRIRDQLLRAVADFYEQPMRFLHNRWLVTKARPLTGKLTLGNKVAILVVYQPKGIAQSLFLTCDHLIEQGYSPFILCNAPLSVEDRNALLARAALLLERPNFGYDFGAYQDGIRLLQRSGCKPDRLILMNDSTWFPLRVGDTAIARMEASGAAFTGHILRNEPDIRRGRDHIESHLLMFDKTALESEAFTKFWAKFEMTSNRVKTILTGEKSISDALSNSGFPLRALISRDQLLDCMANASFDKLKKILTETTFNPININDNLPYLISIAVDSPEWREKVLNHCRDLFIRLSPIFSTTFVYGTMTELGLGFIKKSNEECFHLTRKRVLELEAADEIRPFHPIIRKELILSVENWRRV